MATLSNKQEAFCQAVAGGMSQSDAYRAAYGCADWKAETTWPAASRLMASDKVRARVAELRAELAARKLWRREDSVMALKTIVSTGKPSEIVAAVKELNAMHGYNAPQKIEHTGPDGRPIALVTRIELFS